MSMCSLAASLAPMTFSLSIASIRTLCSLMSLSLLLTSLMINNLAEQMYRYRFEYIKDVSQHKVLVEEHDAIFRAIADRDKNAAKKAAKIHIDNQEIAVMKQIRLEIAAKENRYDARRV